MPRNLLGTVGPASLGEGLRHGWSLKVPRGCQRQPPVKGALSVSHPAHIVGL